MQQELVYLKPLVGVFSPSLLHICAAAELALPAPGLCKVQQHQAAWPQATYMQRPAMGGAPGSAGPAMCIARLVQPHLWPFPPPPPDPWPLPPPPEPW